MTEHINIRAADGDLPSQTNPIVETDPAASPKSVKTKVKSLGHETKAKTKRFLKKHRLGHHHDDDGAGDADEHEDAEEKQDSPYDIIDDDPAFDPSQLVGHKRDMSIDDVQKQLVGGLKGGFKALVHPQSMVKRKAATKVTDRVQDRPYLSEEADMEFLEAHDNLSKAKSGSSDIPSEGEQDLIDERHERVKTLEGLRQSRKVAWTTSRHIQRVLVIPKRDFPAPAKEDFYVVDANTGQRRLDWQSYIRIRNYNALKGFAVNSMGSVDFAGQPPFDRAVLQRYMERILIASSPWQSWFTSLRKLYLWEDPAQTKKWFAIWSVVWYLNFIGTFTVKRSLMLTTEGGDVLTLSQLAYAAYHVLENKFRPKGVQHMRESYERSRTQGMAASKFNELISQHGSGKWLDPIVDSVGPIVQLQMSDTADFLESLNNFYEWRSPEKTWATLFWFLCAILTGTLTPTEYTMKILWMFCILTFFLSLPVASLHPEYRHVVNGLKWIFWDIPNEADSSMEYLRMKAQETRADLISRKVQEEHDNDITCPPEKRYVGSFDAPMITKTKPSEDTESVFSDSDMDDTASFHTADSTTSILGGLDIMSFRCYLRGKPGRLVIFSDGLRFQRTSPIASMRKEDWSHPWTELVEIRKVNHTVLPSEGLFFSFTDGSNATLERLHRRDKAFNCILGFSGLRFQVIEPATETDCHETAMGAADEFHDADQQ